MASLAAANQIGQPIGQTSKSKSNKSAKQTNKDPKRCSWRDNHANPLLSGIEFRDLDSDELVHFITIQHKEIHKEASPFRITVPVNEDGTFTMPRKQTFEEMIQAKRRQQNSHYSSGHHSTTSSVLSDRAARRVSAAARRQSSASNNTLASSRPSSSRMNPVAPPEAAPPAPPVATSSKSSKSSKKSKTKKKKSSKSSSSKSGGSKTKNTIVEPEEPMEEEEEEMETDLAPVAASTSSSSSTPVRPVLTTKDEPTLMISSVEEIIRQFPELATCDLQKLTITFKLAPIGHTITAPNGAVIKKTRKSGTKTDSTDKSAAVATPPPQLVASTSSAASIMTNSTTAPVPTTSATNSSPSKLSVPKAFEIKTSGEEPETFANRPVQLISSMKELARLNPELGSIDKKEIKRMLKQAPPGTSIFLSNGTVIKKSRRGGARAGAGRKRSRPLPNGGSQSTISIAGSQQQDSRSSLTNMSTSSGDQTILVNTTNTSESNAATPTH